MRRALAALLVAPFADAAPGDPFGNEFRVNTTTAGYQRTADVARDAQGNSVVVWQGAQGQDIFARLYDAGGAPLTGQITVNQFRPGYVEAPAVAMTAAGRFVVVWRAAPGFAVDGEIAVRAFRLAGTALTDELTLNAVTSGDQAAPDIAFDPDGDFVAVWTAEVTSGASSTNIKGRRVSSNLATAGPEFRIDPADVNANGGYGLGAPSVAVNAAGNFNVVWAGLRFNDEQFVSTAVIWSRDFFANGTSDNAFVVEEVGQSEALRVPAVALDDANALLVTYRAKRDSHPTVNHEIYGVLYGPSAVEYFRADDGTFEGGGVLSLGATDEPGRFTLAWDALGVDGSKRGVRARRFTYSAAGADPTVSAQGSPVLVNTLTLSDQFDPAIALAPDGSALVAWTSALQDGDNDGIYGQFFKGGSGGPDTVPNAFHFTDKENLDYGIKVRSNAVTIAGIDAPAPISIRGSASGRYSVNGSAFTRAAGTVVAGDKVRLRLTTGDTEGAVRRAILDVGGVTDEWTATTYSFGRRAADDSGVRFTAALPSGSGALNRSNHCRPRMSGCGGDGRLPTH